MKQICTMCLDAVMTTELPALQAEGKKEELKRAIEARLEEVLPEIYAQVGAIAVDQNFNVEVGFYGHDDHNEFGETAPIPDAETLRLMLMLIDIEELPLATIESWTQAQRAEIADYIGAVHMKASDNDDIEVPPVPELLKQYGRNR